LRGHLEPDDQAYVDPAELARWSQRDPLERQRSRILELGLADASDLAAMQARISRHIDEAVAFAEASPWPDPATLPNHVYA
jgi:pyruvate dehydrogenase E1 component alpha subunit